MNEKWKNLEECYDFEKLKMYFSDDELNDFEEEITAYLDNEDEYDCDNASYIVCWYTGMIETEDLIEAYC